MPAFFAYPLAALAEIAGCFAIWAWWRLGATPLWILPEACALLAFGWLLAQVDTSVAGHAFAAYGGVYIAASVAWMWLVEGQQPDRGDVIGVAVCLIGAAISLLGPRNALS